MPGCLNGGCPEVGSVLRQALRPAAELHALAGETTSPGFLIEGAKSGDNHSLSCACSGGRGRASAEAALAEKKISILERALEHHPASDVLLLELLRLVR